MDKNEIIKQNEKIYRVLYINKDKALVIDCLKATMPIWVNIANLNDYEIITEEDLLAALNVTLPNYDSLTNIQRKHIQNTYNIIGSIIPFVDNSNERSEMIAKMADKYQLSKQTIRHHLTKYLIFQNITCFVKQKKPKALTYDERNFKFILSKYFYSSAQRSLHNCYIYLLREKYSDSNGNLIKDFPPYHRFKYFYYKNRRMDSYYIARFGRFSYEKLNRPLLGDAKAYFGEAIIAQCDSTIGDIYLVDENQKLIGRPNISICIDSYSELILGFTVSYEGGTSSLVELIKNVNENKVEYCKKFGISIDETTWSNQGLPNKLLTDRGKDYLSQNFNQLVDLGIELEANAPFSPQCKGMVEKAFDILQSYYKQYLFNNGVVRKDFRMRGAVDYRKKATLTIEEFHKIFLLCVIHFNSKRIIKNMPYECVQDSIKPFANDIFRYKYQKNKYSFIQVSNDLLEKTLYKRVSAKWTRQGLVVSSTKLRYRALNYTNCFLEGGTCVVATNPQNVSYVFLISQGEYIRFDLVESFFDGLSEEQVKEIKKKKKVLIKEHLEDSLKSEMNLGVEMDNLVKSKKATNIKVQNIRTNRQNEIKKERLKKGN